MVWCGAAGSASSRTLAVNAVKPASFAVSRPDPRAVTLHRRLTARGSGRDTAKLAGFTAFTASVRLNAEPAAPHHTIDNRLDAGATLQAQVTALLRSLPQEDVR